MKIAIGCDHVALELKNLVIEHLKANNHEVLDVGPYTSERTHYPIYAHKVCEAILNKEADEGILICGTGVGMSIAANKHKGIRAVVCSDTFSPRLSKQHNNSNIVCFGARVVGYELAFDIVDNFINATYEGGRHQERVEMLEKLDKR
jgi:ribose 5-phosphate isomerase B